jgi:DNA replication protein DnaC
MPDICPLCEGSGHRIVLDSSGNRFAQACSCRIQIRIDRALAQSRIPARYGTCTLDTYEFDDPNMSSAFLVAHRFATGYPVSTEGRGILFTGSSGLGKTHLSVSILKYVIAQRGATGFFWEHKELLDKLRSIYSLRTAGAEDKLLRSIITCDLLVIDDLGDITPSDWSWDTTSYILNSRYNENLSTIITTNLPNEVSFVPAPGEERSQRADIRRAMSRETLGDRIGERMRSRLQEMCVIVEMQGKDFRQRVKRASFGRLP